ncbi:MAG: hypothetical protein ACW991_10150, partial [Candidatus Hodarchaeales archaeon]
IAEGGGAILMPMGGLIIIFSLFLLLLGFLHMNTVFVYVILTLILATLVCVTYFLAKRWFNREKLVLSI